MPISTEDIASEDGALKASIDADLASRAAADDPLIGWYRVDPSRVTNAVFTVTREGERLFVQQTGSPRTPLVPDAAGRFSTLGLEQRYRFETTPPGRARALVIEMPAETIRAERIDGAEAKAVQAAFARDLAEQALPRTRITLPPRLLDRYVGAYAGISGLVITVRRRGAALFAEASGQAELEILPEAEGRFFYAVMPAQLEFRGSPTQAETLTLHQHGHATLMRRVTEDEARRVAAEIERKRAEQERPRIAVQVPPEPLARYAGLYQMSPSSELAVTLENERLFGQATRQRRFKMFPESVSEFFATVAAIQFSFLTGEDGEVDRVIVHWMLRTALPP